MLLITGKFLPSRNKSLRKQGETGRTPIAAQRLFTALSPHTKYSFQMQFKAAIFVIIKTVGITALQWEQKA